MTQIVEPIGDPSREAIDALKGYVYQIYQTALAWIELQANELLFIEVAEDFAIVTTDELKGIQVKGTAHTVTINSKDIIDSIDSFSHLCQKNPSLSVELIHLTTSVIGKERAIEDRIGNTPTLDSWRQLARGGDIEPLKKILQKSKLKEETKKHINSLSPEEFRSKFLKQIHFICGASDSSQIKKELHVKVQDIILSRGGESSLLNDCINKILITILETATKITDRYVDKLMFEKIISETTQITINRKDFNKLNQLVCQILSRGMPTTNNTINTRITPPRPIDDIPFPSIIAERSTQIDKIIDSVIQNGIGWISGATGVGKTLGARIVSNRIGGAWAIVNMRGVSDEQVELILTHLIDMILNKELDGILIDDLNVTLNSNTIDRLLYFLSYCKRKDLLVIITSTKSLDSALAYIGNLPTTIETKLEAFTKVDIKGILIKLNIINQSWTDYIYLVSAGHPQLVIAEIQYLQNLDWDVKEFQTLNSLLEGTTEIDNIRKKTRERLLSELPDNSRRILERLSVKAGSFNRDFLLSLSQISPVIQDAGIIFDSLIGTWIDQLEKDRFSLSPLLTGYSNNTLSEKQRNQFHYDIADILTEKKSIDVTNLDAIFISALIGKNSQVLVNMCYIILKMDQSEIEKITPYLLIPQSLTIEKNLYQDDLYTSFLLRGIQLLLLSQSKDQKNHFKEAYNRFKHEKQFDSEKQHSNLFTLLINIKLLLCTSQFGALPGFLTIIKETSDLYKEIGINLSKASIKPGCLEDFSEESFIGFLFLNQACQIKTINDLQSVFLFLDSCKKDFRNELMAGLKDPILDIEMFVTGAWLEESDNNTINPDIHEKVYQELEDLAYSWEQVELAVSCCKIRAIIIDEYANQKDQALSIINDGLKRYGKNQVNLYRQKAKILFRAKDFKESLYYSNKVFNCIDGINSTEKIFLAREAAICAEKEKKYGIARKYFLIGREFVELSANPSILPLRIGFLGDAALASWKLGDKKTSLMQFSSVLEELSNLNPNDSLRAAHINALSRHALLWIYQEASGKKILIDNQYETIAVPGMISNPEPNPEIKNKPLALLEISWYMLAAVENFLLVDVGINKNLTKYLCNKSFLEGQFLLTESQVVKALKIIDTQLFLLALKDRIHQFVIFSSGKENNFNVQSGTLVGNPILPDHELSKYYDLFESFMLLYIAMSIINNRTINIKSFTNMIINDQKIFVRNEFISCLKQEGIITDYNLNIAKEFSVIYSKIDKNECFTPKEVFIFALRTLQLASQTKIQIYFIEPIFSWVKQKWDNIWENQRFLLHSPTVYITEIEMSYQKPFSLESLIDLLIAILPTIGLRNENDINIILNNMRTTGNNT